MLCDYDYYVIIWSIGMDNSYEKYVGTSYI